jgi:hypothetical protein
LSGQHIRTRTQLYERDLTFLFTQDFAKRRVHEAKLRTVQSKRDGKLQFLRGSGIDQRFMQLAVMRKVGRISLNRLLEIADHAEMAGSRSG